MAARSPGAMSSQSATGSFASHGSSGSSNPATSGRSALRFVMQALAARALHGVIDLTPGMDPNFDGKEAPIVFGNCVEDGVGVIQSVFMGAINPSIELHEDGLAILALSDGATAAGVRLLTLADFVRSDDAFAQQLQGTFEGDFKLHFHLGAWPFAKKDPVTGKLMSGYEAMEAKLMAGGWTMGDAASGHQQLLGIGAGVDGSDAELALTTENSRGVTQLVAPTFPVVTLIRMISATPVAPPAPIHWHSAMEIGLRSGITA